MKKAVAIDVSGSMQQDKIEEAIKLGYEHTILTFDEKVLSVYEPGETVPTRLTTRGGGTDLKCVFKYAADNGIECLTIVSDFIGY